MREAKFMSRAITLAMRGRPHTAPNPCVGAVLVHNDVIVAEGYHTACGKPHAEVEALRDAKTKGITPSHCTLYVTLEPCSHHGRTPPCSDALVRAGLVWASEVGAERVMLEVDAANAPALALYRGLGFEAIATRTGYYGPGADAVIMSRDVAPADGPGAASGESETEKKVEA